MLSFVSIAFISVGCLSSFTAFLSRRQSQHLTLGVLFNTPLLLVEAKETLINSFPRTPTHGPSFASGTLWSPKERCSEWSFCFEYWLGKKTSVRWERG
jgi:hypothetical protein